MRTEYTRRMNGWQQESHINYFPKIKNCSANYNVLYYCEYEAEFPLQNFDPNAHEKYEANKMQNPTFCDTLCASSSSSSSSKEDNKQLQADTTVTANFVMRKLCP